MLILPATENRQLVFPYTRCTTPICHGSSFGALTPQKSDAVHRSGITFTRLRGGQVDQAPHNGPQSIQFGVLRNLLNWSTSITNSSQQNGTRAPLDPERIRWLQDAMNSLLENTTDVFRQSIGIIQEPDIDAESVERKEQALDIIRDRVEHLDLAVGLDNMGGLKPSVDCLESPHSTIRLRAADVIAAAVANHEKLQQVGIASYLLYPA